MVLSAIVFSAAVQNGAPAQDTASSFTEQGSLARDSVASSALAANDSILLDTAGAAAAAGSEPRKLKLIKRKYNSRQQVLLATGMMLFVVGIITMAQQWNPR